MNYYVYSKDKYDRIISVLCETMGIDNKELVKILQDRQCKYLMFLFLKKYKCADAEKLKIDFSIENKKTFNYTCKRAEELFLINKQFRELYFRLDELIENQ